MRKFALVALVVVAVATAATPEMQRIQVVRPEAAPAPGAPERFTGKAFVKSRFEGTRPSHLVSALVSFEAGARTAWHTHPHGQLLVVTSGCGWVQQRGGEAQQIRVGDIVWTPPGVAHWHGAGAKVPMSHAVVHERFDTQEVTWMQKVSAEEYGSAVCEP